MAGRQAYQDQRGVIKPVSGVDVDAESDLFLADFQIASPRSLTEEVEIMAEIERVLIFQAARRNVLLLGMQRGL